METGIKFKAASLANFDVIDAPGKYILSVFSNVTEANLVDGKYIVGLRAIAQDKMGDVQATFSGKSEVAIEETNGLFLTANLWLKADGSAPALPMKGEEVEATISYVPNRQEEQVLRVTNIRVAAAKKASKLDLVNFLAETPEVEHSETISQSK